MRVDLPALGRPTKQAKPARWGEVVSACWAADSWFGRALMATILPDPGGALVQRYAGTRRNAGGNGRRDAP
ncbi:hypothetical protein GCM10010253_01730 [Streptomyces badius]|uniref:Transposase n=1 Tax=Streptomyces badius TaxID=1941 RepID=A0ABQ2SK21_STRBA|nr:hypothetical protein GCM10010253_01730 [Streptomyces badius]